MIGLFLWICRLLQIFATSSLISNAIVQNVYQNTLWKVDWIKKNIHGVKQLRSFRESRVNTADSLLSLHVRQRVWWRNRPEDNVACSDEPSSAESSHCWSAEGPPSHPSSHPLPVHKRNMVTTVKHFQHNYSVRSQHAAHVLLFFSDCVIEQLAQLLDKCPL